MTMTAEREREIRTPLDSLTMATNRAAIIYGDRIRDAVVEIDALRAALARLTAENKELLRAVVEMAIPYEGIRGDAESQRWIAPEVWRHIVEATDTARALLPRAAAKEGT